MAAVMKTRLIPVDRYVQIAGAATYCMIQSRNSGVRVFVGQVLPDPSVKDYFSVSSSAQNGLVLPPLDSTDLVFARAEKTPTTITVLSDATVISGF